MSAAQMAIDRARALLDKRKASRTSADAVGPPPRTGSESSEGDKTGERVREEREDDDEAAASENPPEPHVTAQTPRHFFVSTPETYPPVPIGFSSPVVYPFQAAPASTFPPPAPMLSRLFSPTTAHSPVAPSGDAPIWEPAQPSKPVVLSRPSASNRRASAAAATLDPTLAPFSIPAPTTNADEQASLMVAAHRHGPQAAANRSQESRKLETDSPSGPSSLPPVPDIVGSGPDCLPLDPEPGEDRVSMIYALLQSTLLENAKLSLRLVEHGSRDRDERDSRVAVPGRTSVGESPKAVPNERDLLAEAITTIVYLEDDIVSTRAELASARDQLALLHASSLSSSSSTTHLGLPPTTDESARGRPAATVDSRELEYDATTTLVALGSELAALRARVESKASEIGLVQRLLDRVVDLEAHHLGGRRERHNEGRRGVTVVVENGVDRVPQESVGRENGSSGSESQAARAVGVEAAMRARASRTRENSGAGSRA
ncbi:hypothetical protein JCM11491_003163 [Sporobolomyces phaffii]